MNIGSASIWRRLIAVAFCCGLEACALRSSPKATVAYEPEPKRLTEPETHRFRMASDQDVVGVLLKLALRDGDNLPDIARHYGLGYEEIAAANPGIDPWVPSSGSTVLIPAQFVVPRTSRRGLLINLAAMRLFRFSRSGDQQEVLTYPIGIGKEDRATPTGPLSIVRKKERPTWYPTENIRNDHARKGDPLPAAVPAGPDNPLGDFALYLSKPTYLIHGTNKPYSVGWRASNGCIRLYPENIQQLFGEVSVREPVLIVNQPYLFGWRDGLVYLQAHPPQQELNDKALLRRLRTDLKSLEQERNHPLDWTRIERVIAEARGVPTPISASAPGVDSMLAAAEPLQHPRKFFGAPVTPPADADRWSILVDETESEALARRLAAFLNHQGPPIPARTEAHDDRFRVVAGPYDTAKIARSSLKRLKLELELNGTVLPPAREIRISGRDTPEAPSKPR